MVINVNKPLLKSIMSNMTKNRFDSKLIRFNAKIVEATATWAILIFLLVNLFGAHMLSHVSNNLLVFNGSILTHN